MENLTCTQCGAPINRRTMTCEYCGTQYKFDHEVIRPIVMESSRAHELCSELSVAKEYVIHNEQGLTEFVCRSIATDLAKGLAPYIEYRSEYDPMTDSIRTSGRVRVLDPKFRF